MIIPCYLALTAAEFQKTAQLPTFCAYMACHYSCYGTGLSNVPDQLPEGSLLILNDRTPADRHDPKVILDEMLYLIADQKPCGVLLDFQRPEIDISREVTRVLTESLPCPVGVTLPYAEGLSCPVFLPPPPLHMPLSDYLAPYEEREVWLELALEDALYIINNKGCRIEPAEHMPLPEPIFTEAASFCRYHIEVMEDRAAFTLQRGFAELQKLLASGCSVSKCIGLYQELKNMPTV